jgi:hypothetical protein
MKKMSEAKKLKPGPKRKLSDSARKRNKKAANAKLNKNRIYIGDEYDRWMEIKTALRLETNSEVVYIIALKKLMVYVLYIFNLYIYQKFLEN